MQVEGQHEQSLLCLMATGARVRNTYPICPRLGDSPSKDGLIPDGVVSPHRVSTKGFPAADEDAYD